jgi:hypothetical protein
MPRKSYNYEYEKGESEKKYLGAPPRGSCMDNAYTLT